MSIIKFFPKHGGRRGSFDDQWKREYTRDYIAISDSAFDQEPEIWQHPLCPVPGETVADWDPLAKCISVEPVWRPKTKYHWDVPVKFSSVQFTQTKSQNPLDDPAEIEVDTELVVEERYQDRNGKPTCNTAGDLVKVMVDIPRTTIIVTKNVALKNAWITKIAGIVNSNSIRINGIPYEPETLKVTKARLGKIEYRNDVAFFIARVEIRHKEEGWASVSLNQGFYELIPDPYGRVVDEAGLPALVRWRCLTGGIEGEPETSPVFLDENGRRPEMVVYENGIPKCRPKTILDPEDIVLNKYDMLKLYDFNLLPLR